MLLFDVQNWGYIAINLVSVRVIMHPLSHSIKLQRLGIFWVDWEAFVGDIMSEVVVLWLQWKDVFFPCDKDLPLWHSQLMLWPKKVQRLFVRSKSGNFNWWHDKVSKLTEKGCCLPITVKKFCPKMVCLVSRMVCMCSSCSRVTLHDLLTWVFYLKARLWVKKMNLPQNFNDCSIWHHGSTLWILWLYVAT